MAKEGRPTKYTEELQAKASEYVNCYKDEGDVIPSIAGLCCYIGVARATIYNWSDIYPEFLDTLNEISENQEVAALNKGLTGDFTPAITKLVLANHGYSDKLIQDNISSDKSQGIVICNDPMEAAKQYAAMMESNASTV